MWLYYRLRRKCSRLFWTFQLQRREHGFINVLQATLLRVKSVLWKHCECTGGRRTYGPKDDCVGDDKDTKNTEQFIVSQAVVDAFSWHPKCLWSMRNVCKRTMSWQPLSWWESWMHEVTQSPYLLSSEQGGFLDGHSQQLILPDDQEQQQREESRVGKREP